MAKKFKGFTGIKIVNGETFKFKNGVTYIGKIKYTLKEILEIAKEPDINEKEYPKAEGW